MGMARSYALTSYMLYGTTIWYSYCVLTTLLHTTRVGYCVLARGIIALQKSVPRSLRPTRPLLSIASDRAYTYRYQIHENGPAESCAAKSQNFFATFFGRKAVLFTACVRRAFSPCLSVSNKHRKCCYLQCEGVCC